MSALVNLVTSDDQILSAEVAAIQAEEESEDNSIDNWEGPTGPIMEQLATEECSEDEEQIDNLIVCKIENEFGYPEEFLLECLYNDRKNDATTCYYLLCKEDKHEVVNLLGESPSGAQKDAIKVRSNQ